MSKTIIFANGDCAYPEKIIHFIQPGDNIICADGGAKYTFLLGIVPDLIIGDLDSLPVDILKSYQQQGVRIEKHPINKDKTDLELALTAARDFPADELLVVTAMGGRLDQLFANIFLLTRNWGFKRAGFMDENEQGWVLSNTDTLTVSGKPGDIISILPLTERIEGVDIIGVEWPLTNKTVEFGSTLTLSNSFTRNSVTVNLKKGICLVIHRY